jgi:cytosine/adenosine deaminase-related metal-dependent hydrolase
MSAGDPVVSDFAMITENGIILETGKWSFIKKAWTADVEDLGDVTITPGLVNAHTHLGLSHFEGLTVKGQGFTGWMQSLVAGPLQTFDGQALYNKVQEMLSQGTVYCADISTSNIIEVAGTLDTTDMAFTAFCESMGNAAPKDGKKLFPEYSSTKGRIAGAGHALYSTNAKRLKAVKNADSAAGLPFSMHLAENQEEDLILAGEECAFGKMLEAAGFLPEFPEAVRPVPYADSLGLLDSQTLAVHCVKVDDRDIDILAERGVGVCLCPRSNLYIGEGRAPWEKIISAGIRTCLGTDSIASNFDLNLWNDLSYLLENIKISLDVTEALSLVTLNPAGILGIDDIYGRLEPGLSASYAVMPSGIEDLLF